jgi:hypothetical protein
MQLSWQAIEKASIVLSFMKRSNDIIKIPWQIFCTHVS